MKEFGEWLPDQVRVDGLGLVQAENVIPDTIRGYRQAFGMSSTSLALPTASTYGVLSVKGRYADFHVALANSSALVAYEYNSGSISSTISTSYTFDGYPVTFQQFGNRFVAAAGENTAIQTVTFDAELTDEDGAPLLLETGAEILIDDAFAEIAGAPAARYLAVVRDFVVAAYVTESGGTTPNRVRWSALNDATSWTVDPTTQSDFQDIPDLGNIVGIYGGEIGIIICERGVVRMTYVGAPIIFQFDVVANVGCPYAFGTVRAENSVYFVSSDGFYVTAGGDARNLSRGKIWENYRSATRDTLGTYDFNDALRCGYDPRDRIVFWVPAAKGGPSGADPTTLAWAMNIDNGRWCLLDGMTVPLGEATSLNAYGYFTFQSPSFKFGIGIDRTTSIGDEICTAAGYHINERLVGVIETPTFTLEQGTTLVTKVHQFGNRVTDSEAALTGTVTVQIASRTKEGDAISYSSAASVNDDNFAPVRSRGRFHSLKFTFTDIARMLGYDITGSTTGLR